uniref:Uncharacterized protein n=1 Tax=Rhizophora mucronata TaxID=61149 RepID=A0A2P2R356_RHIMU
MQYKIPNGTRF